MRKLSIFILVLFLTGCAHNVTIPRDSKNALRYAPDVIIENKIFDANYQYLAKCWDERAEKLSVDFSNATFLNIYSELDLAEIIVKWSSFGNKAYAILIELRKKSNTETIVNAYGLGYFGKKYIPEWLSVMQSCSKVSTSS